MLAPEFLSASAFSGQQGQQVSKTGLLTLESYILLYRRDAAGTGAPDLIVG